MALQNSFTTPHGFTTQTAYARITSFNGDKDSIRVNVEVHKDAQARSEEKQPIGLFTISLELPNGATMQQMYDALKLVDPFIGSVDV